MGWISSTVPMGTSGSVCVTLTYTEEETLVVSLSRTFDLRTVALTDIREFLREAKKELARAQAIQTKITQLNGILTSALQE